MISSSLLIMLVWLQIEAEEVRSLFLATNYSNKKWCHLVVAVSPLVDTPPPKKKSLLEIRKGLDITLEYLDCLPLNYH